MKRAKRQRYVHTDPGVLPFRNTRFIFVQAVDSLAKTPHASWSASLSSMKQAIQTVGSFDVALIACGAYALPLAVFIKSKLNASAITLGGNLQQFFGLKLRREDPCSYRGNTSNWMNLLESDGVKSSTTENNFNPYAAAGMPKRCEY